MARTFTFQAMKADLKLNIRHDGTLTGRGGRRLGRFESVDHAAAYCQRIDFPYGINADA